MPVLNSEIAETFDEIADLLEIESANPFRVRAYRNAARVVSSWPSSLAGRAGSAGAFRVLKAIEVDILEDGSLDLPEELLGRLDLTVCSIHFRFELSTRKQTERVIRAMDHPSFRILGHPTARLVGRRSGLDLDVEKVMKAARERGCVLELNSQPARLDLSDSYCRLAKEIGVKLAISTDAHSANDLGYMRLGVEQARRGWLESGDVINTRPWPELLRLLRR